MSNFGQGALAVVGAVVGYYLGGATGAAWGFQLGLGAGTVLFPTQLPGQVGPRLQDSQQTSTQIGTPIPRVWGVQVVGGIIVWASPIREQENTDSVGGSGTEQDVTTFAYYRSWAVLLTDGEIAGVRRIWFNGKLRLDRTPQGENESYEQLQQRLMANQAFMSKVTLYLGTETQLPDPTIESFEGVGNVPAYRGYSLAVFNDLLLEGEDGNRMPAQMKFEVFTDASITSQDATQYSTNWLHPWAPDVSGRSDPRNLLNTHVVTMVSGSGDGISGPWATIEQALEAKSDITGLFYNYIMGTCVNIGTAVATIPNSETDGYLSSMGAPRAADYDADYIEVHYNYLDFQYIVTGSLLPGTAPLSAMDAAGYPAGGRQYILLDSVFPGDITGSCVAYRAGVTESAAWPNGFHTDRYITEAFGSQKLCFEWDSIKVRLHRIPHAPWAAEDDPRGTPMPGIDGYTLINGHIYKNGPWVLHSGTAKALSVYTVNAYNKVTRYPLNPTLPLGHLQYNDAAFWTAAYEQLVLQGVMPAGLIYGIDYPVVQAFWYQRDASDSVVAINEIPLSEVVGDICETVGRKTSLQYDVSDLQTRFIKGFKMGTPMTARAAIEPLRSVGYFDCVEDGITIRFPTRGKAIVDALGIDDLGAIEAGSSHAPSSTTQKTLELDLPRQIRVHYQCEERNWDPGEESSPPRVDTRAETVVDVELAVAIPSNQAAQIAEVIHRDIWTARYGYGTQLDISKGAIQPTDAVTMPVDDVIERMRVANASDMLPNMRALQFVKDDGDNYVSTATSSQEFPVPVKMPFYGPVEAVLLDLPLLDVENEVQDSGFYLAARPVIANGDFRSLTLLRGNGGDTFVRAAQFTQVGKVTSPTPMGILGEALAAGITGLPDYERELIVDMQYGSPESRALLDVLAGANMAAVGADGRWEVLQFIDVEDLGVLPDYFGASAGLHRYRLTGLLRGVRGTEWYMGAAAGDRFVLLSGGTLARVQLPGDLVNREQTYRTAGGSGTVDPTDVFFTGFAKALQPFAPVHVVGDRTEALDWAISFMRRDRLATDLIIPMSEETEKYELDILRAGVKVRTISTGTTAAVYPASKQVVDFGAVQTSLTVRVYQSSKAVGRSNPIQVELSA